MMRAGAARTAVHFRRPVRADSNDDNGKQVNQPARTLVSDEQHFGRLCCHTCRHKSPLSNQFPLFDVSCAEIQLCQAVNSN
jgi:hypothetical protein